MAMLLSSVKKSLIWLCGVWFFLCASLVSKHNELISVFFSFVSSFALAFCLTALAEVSAQKNVAVYMHAKNQVGLVACTIAMILLLLQPDIFFSKQQHMKPDFLAVSILTGYLAFDLWYTLLFHSKITTLQSVGMILEDTLTLTAFLVGLSLSGHHLDPYLPCFLSWILYKTIVLATRVSSTASKATLTSSTTTKEQQQQQVVKDNSLLWTVHGVQYDLSEYVDRHPGGKDAIELGRGRDCSAMFESYHPFTDQHRIVLKKYQVDKTQKPSPSATDPFYDVLKERVSAVLKGHGIDPIRDRTASWSRWFQYVVVVLGVLVCGYAHAFRGSVLFGSFGLGVFGWLVGALGHDAGHFSASRQAMVNRYGVWVGMSLLCNPALWQHQHTFAHHSHTNEFDKDPDLHHFHALLRIHRRFRHKPLFRYQRHWWFVVFAYTFVAFGECFWIPLDMMQTGTLYGLFRVRRSFSLLLHTILYAGLVMVAPFCFAPTTGKAFLCVVTHIWTAGLLFGFFSQINHLNESSLERTTTNSWAASQVETSNNFATNSWFWHIFSNGLNLQIEHHLFPGLNHAHLHLIAPVVEKTCREHGVQYKSYNSWNEIMGATLAWLDQISQE